MSLTINAAGEYKLLRTIFYLSFIITGSVISHLLFSEVSLSSDALLSVIARTFYYLSIPSLIYQILFIINVYKGKIKTGILRYILNISFTLETVIIINFLGILNNIFAMPVFMIFAPFLLNGNFRGLPHFLKVIIFALLVLSIGYQIYYYMQYKNKKGIFAVESMPKTVNADSIPVKIIENTIPQTDCSHSLSLMNVATVKQIREFHKSFPQYSVTPLQSLDNLAIKHNVGGIYVKDESERFNLQSFKALGCTYAIASYIAQKLGKSVWELDYETLPQAAKKLGEFTFYAATDGNHGRAVAWAAQKLGQKAVIYMNKGCPRVRMEHILYENAEVNVTEVNYDDTIRLIRILAEKTPNSVIIQDTAWEGYEEIPGWIMQGYAVMALEACEQLLIKGITPTHVIFQAGVGAFAGAAQACISNYYGDKAPITIIVEPANAACYYESAKRGDGERVCVGGEMKTIMAGLACGEPNSVAWDIIRNKCKYFATIADEHTREAMRTLAKPIDDDPKIKSGESGAAGMGLLLKLLTSDDMKTAELRDKVGIGPDSHILLFNTEGDTDPDSYRKIVFG